MVGLRKKLGKKMKDASPLALKGAAAQEGLGNRWHVCRVVCASMRVPGAWFKGGLL